MTHPSFRQRTVRHTALQLLALATLFYVEADPTYLECNGLTTRVKQGKPIMGAHPKQVNASELPFKMFRYNSTGGDWVNYSVVNHAGKEIEFILQAVDNMTLTNFVHPNFGVCGNDPAGDNKKLCLKCSTQLYANSYSCFGNAGCLFGVRKSGVHQQMLADMNMNVLIGWSKGKESYGTGLVTYASFDLNTVPVIPPPAPPPLPACTGAAKDFCDHDWDSTWCCNFFYHGCVCTDFGDYNFMKNYCSSCKDQCIHCANKKGKCKYAGADVHDCCPAAPQCKKNEKQVPWDK